MVKINKLYFILTIYIYLFINIYKYLKISINIFKKMIKVRVDKLHP